MPPERTNQQWLDDLAATGQAFDDALRDLRAILERGLGYALESYREVQAEHIQDFAQDALLRLLPALDTFRGESRFVTWANKIAVRVAFTEMRRKRWEDIPLARQSSDGEMMTLPKIEVDPTAPPEKQAIQRDVTALVGHVIQSGLTPRQREAMMAVLVQGMPIAEVADRMGTNRNALYKLLHDARKSLKRELEGVGVSAQEVLAAFAPA